MLGIQAVTSLDKLQLMSSYRAELTAKDESSARQIRLVRRRLIITSIASNFPVREPQHIPRNVFI